MSNAQTKSEREKIENARGRYQEAMRRVKPFLRNLNETPVDNNNRWVNGAQESQKMPSKVTQGA